MSHKLADIAAALGARLEGDGSITVTGTIVWCRKTNRHFEVGVRFADENTEFAVRMIEQICHINHYQRQILEREGRQLSGEEAALEWVARFARDFPA